MRQHVQKSLIRTGVYAVALAVAASACAMGTAPAALAGTAPASLRGVNVLGWGFDDPAAVTAAGNRIWVANDQSNTVVELSARTGALIRVISGSRH